MEDLKKEELNNERDELIRVKEERLRKEGVEEEEIAETKPDTAFRKVLKSLGFFWEYYKWFVIIPAIIVVICIIFVTSYIDESREVDLDISIMNTDGVMDAYSAIMKEYPKYKNVAAGDMDIRIEYNLSYPLIVGEAAGVSDTDIAAIQKFVAMVKAGRVDVAITNTWVVDDFSSSAVASDLSAWLSEDLLEEYGDRIYYATTTEGVTYPAAIYLYGCPFLSYYDDENPPVLVSFTFSEHTEEALDFARWVLSTCEETK